MKETILELAEEFESDAELLEKVARQYECKSIQLGAGHGAMMSQILWHEGAVYRCCALRVRAMLAESAQQDGGESREKL